MKEIKELLKNKDFEKELTELMFSCPLVEDERENEEIFNREYEKLLKKYE